MEERDVLREENTLTISNLWTTAKKKILLILALVVALAAVGALYSFFFSSAGIYGYGFAHRFCQARKNGQDDNRLGRENVYYRRRQRPERGKRGAFLRLLDRI